MAISVTNGNRLTSGLVRLSLIAGMAVSAAVVNAPVGGASCMSLFGRNNTDQCFSSATSVAIALGDSAAASAGGFFSLAFADSRGVATSATGCSLSDGGGLDGCTVAQAYQAPYRGGPLSRAGLAVAAGEGSNAVVDGTYGNVAVSLGAGSGALVTAGSLNAAINVATRNSAGGTTEAIVWSGNRNLAANAGTSSQGGLLLAEVNGSRSIAANIGTVNTSSAGATAQAGSRQQPASSSKAFALRGKNNQVVALGDQAVAGAVKQSGATVTQTGPGNDVVKTPAGVGAVRALAAARSAR
jgi:hypothetical protein